MFRFVVSGHRNITREGENFIRLYAQPRGEMRLSMVLSKVIASRDTYMEKQEA